VRGIFTYRGGLVPLVDLGLRLADRVPAERLSTRVIVVEFALPADARRARLGLVAEDVIAICSAEDAAASLPPLGLPEARYLGRVLRLGDRTVQLLDPGHLLPDELAAGLFPAAAEAGQP